jgi:diaminopimelate epimerase
MKFWKYHGIGNDFIILDGSDGNLPIDNRMCRNLCDRHYGIGADGVIYIMPGENDSDISMRIINSDGSEAEMCGNGIRCLSKHVYDFGIVDKEQFTVNTRAGRMEALVNLKEGRVSSVRVNMGAPILDGRSVPIDYDGKFIDEVFTIDGLDLRCSAISMGNPHFVTFSELSDDKIEKLGPTIESHPFFPNKTNVEFCEVLEGKVHVKVYERGASWTLACGTGACASATAAALKGLVSFDTPIDVHLPGGWLKITVNRDLKYVLMEGPAELVYEGNVGE